MGKLLSVCLPCYNMEKYLDRSVGSMLLPEIIDKIEIIIVNDGSKDHTIEVANRYKQQYPKSIVVIDKSNGHYGSCVNAALKIATGKYFRILDPDDWFDNEGLRKILSAIESVDADCFFTLKTICYVADNRTQVNYIDRLKYESLIELDKYQLPKEALSMHSLTYKTDLLKEIGYNQTEGICYTDVEYVCIPLCHAKTLYALNDKLYIYMIGRDDQSVSVSSNIKNKSHRLSVLKNISSLNGIVSNREYIVSWCIYVLISALITTLYYDDFTDVEKEELKGIIHNLKKQNGALYSSLKRYVNSKWNATRLWFNFETISTLYFKIKRHS